MVNGVGEWFRSVMPELRATKTFLTAQLRTDLYLAQMNSSVYKITLFVFLSEN